MADNELQSEVINELKNMIYSLRHDINEQKHFIDELLNRNTKTVEFGTNSQTFDLTKNEGPEQIKYFLNDKTPDESSIVKSGSDDTDGQDDTGTGGSGLIPAKITETTSEYAIADLYANGIDQASTKTSVWVYSLDNRNVELIPDGTYIFVSLTNEKYYGIFPVSETYPVSLTAKIDDDTYSGKVYPFGYSGGYTESITIKINSIASGETIPNLGTSSARFMATLIDYDGSSYYTIDLPRWL